MLIIPMAATTIKMMAQKGKEEPFLPPPPFLFPESGDNLKNSKGSCSGFLPFLLSLSLELLIIQPHNKNIRKKKRIVDTVAFFLN